MLADFQTTLSQQARTLAQRTRARMDVDADERVKTFVESLERAAGLMEPAAGHLSAFRLQEAVTPEQQALQQLLRAEVGVPRSAGLDAAGRRRRRLAGGAQLH